MKTWNLIMAAAVTAGLCAGQARGATIESAGSGLWTNGTTWVGGVTPGINDEAVITNGCTVTMNDMVTRSVSNLTIQAGGVLTHTAHAGGDTTEKYKVILTIANNLTIDAGGAINVSSNGYAVGKGPGYAGYQAGGSHGGRGGYNSYLYESGLPYGSLTAPTNCGSGGSIKGGGGAAVLTVGGTSTVNGTIAADGVANPGAGNDFSGAGGSTYLRTGYLSGSGTIRANGGAVGRSGGGGGGRVAVILTNSTDFGGVVLQAYVGSSGDRVGVCGTIYTETRDQGSGNGTLLINNNNVGSQSDSMTLIWTNVTDTAVGTVIVTNGARLAISNQTLTVRGDWINKATFSAQANSTVNFAGTNAATILTSTSNAFYHLVCTNASKTLRFQDKQTNTVNGVLTLNGPTLDSVSGTNAWCLKVSSLTHSVSNVTVRWSDARPGAPVEARDSTDQGNNYNWVFAAGGCETNVWTGATDTTWGQTNNWSLKRATVFTDTVLIPGSCPKYPVLDNHKRLFALTIGSGGSLGMSGYDLTVDGTIAVTGTLTAAGAATIRVGGDLDFSGNGTFNAASSTVWVAGSGAQRVVSGGNAFFLLTVSNNLAPVVFADAVTASNLVNMANPVFFGGAVMVASVLRTYGTNVVFGGALTGGALDNRNGALVCSGAVTVAAFTNWAGDLTFRDDMTAGAFYSAPGGMTHTFRDGKTVTVGNLEWYGHRGYPVVLRSASEGNAWNLNVTNWSKVRQADVKDSNAQPGLTIYPVASTNNGGNTNWVFDPAWQTWVGTNSVFTNANNWVPAGVPGTGSRLLIEGYYTNAPVLSGVATAAQVIVGGETTATLTVSGTLTVGADVEVLPNGTITHAANSGTSEANKLTLIVGSNLTVSGQINVDGKGYAAGNGPGKPAGNAAASYGGLGGYNSTLSECGLTYGSLTVPTNCGSGAAVSGGGAALLYVSGTTTVNGLISADGYPTAPLYYGGSGGSVYLRTGALAGSGIIRAKGGPTTSQMPGGGGRVAVILTNSTTFGAVSLQAYVGSGSDYRGSCGTIYTETSQQGLGNGTLLVDATNIAARTGITTFLWTNVTDTAVGTVIITNGAILAISNQTLTVRGDWINKATFLAQTNSTVNFAGATAATIYTNNTFFNLTCTNAGKTLVFEAGRTNTVTGLLKLGASQSGQMVTLQSTTPGSWSYLTLTPGGTQQIARVNVKDNNAGGGQFLVAGGGSANGGNNVNWQFPPSGTMFMVK